MASGEVRSARKSGWYRASLPKAWPAVQSTTAFHSLRQECCLLTCDLAFEHNRSVHHDGRHRPHSIRVTFLTHLLRRAAPLDHFAAAGGHRISYQPQGLVAERAARRENFD